MGSRFNPIIFLLKLFVPSAAVLLFIQLSAGDNLPEPSWVYKGQGDRYLWNGDFGNAIVSYKKALLKRQTGTGEDGRKSYPEVNLQLAKIYLSEDLFELAFSQISIAERERDSLEIPDLIFEIRYLKAEILSRWNRNAEPIYREIIEADENWFFYWQKPPSELPVEFFIENKALMQKFGKAYFELGKIKYAYNNFENAALFFHMAFLYRYENESTINLLINSYTKSGNSVMAERIRDYIKKQKL